MSAAEIRAVLFDLDGTLLDTAPDLVGALNHVREREGMPPVAVEEFRHFVSQGALGLIRAGLPASDEEELEVRRQRFLAHYQAHLHEFTAPFEGIEALLEALQLRGIPWGVVTNKPEYLTFPIIAAIGWQRRAACVICGDTLARNKPDPAPVLMACELLGVPPGQAIMVGDDPRDLDAGEAAGTHTALAAYGYGAGEVLDSGRALQHIFEHPSDILNLDGMAGSAGAG